jgi:hypothetical protein
VDTSPVTQPDRLDPDSRPACYADLAGGFTADRGPPRAGSA